MLEDLIEIISNENTIFVISGEKETEFLVDLMKKAKIDRYLLSKEYVIDNRRYRQIFRESYLIFVGFRCVKHLDGEAIYISQNYCPSIRRNTENYYITTGFFRKKEIPLAILFWRIFEELYDIEIDKGLAKKMIISITEENRINPVNRYSREIAEMFGFEITNEEEDPFIYYDDISTAYRYDGNLIIPEVDELREIHETIKIDGLSLYQWLLGWNAKMDKEKALENYKRKILERKTISKRERIERRLKKFRIVLENEEINKYVNALGCRLYGINYINYRITEKNPIQYWNMVLYLPKRSILTITSLDKKENWVGGLYLKKVLIYLP